MRFPLSSKLLLPALGVGVVVLGAVIAENWRNNAALTKSDYVGTIDVSVEDARLYRAVPFSWHVASRAGAFDGKDQAFVRIDVSGESALLCGWLHMDKAGASIRATRWLSEARLKVGDVARVRVDSLRNMMLNGEIKRIATVASESTIDRTRVFPVDVVLDETDPRLRPGMSATVMFTLSHVENVTAVPLSAVFANADSVRYVFVRKNEGFEVRGIDIGIADTRRVQIISGLVLEEEIAVMRPIEFTGEIPIAKPALPPKARGSRFNKL